MKKGKLDVTLDPKIYDKYMDHLDKVGYDKNKLFQKIIEDFLKKNE